MLVQSSLKYLQRWSSGSLWASSLWLTTLQHLSLFCRYMTAKRMIQGKSLVWGIWTANAWKQNDFLAVTIPFCKAVLTSWGMRQWKCHNICNIFASTLLQNGLFVPPPFVWMKELRRDLGWFYSQYIYSHPFYRFTQGLRERKKALAAHTCWDRISKSKVSPHYENLRMIMGKSLEFDVLSFSWMLGVCLK